MELITRDDIRNIAIIAHVDHGKTTLVDQLLKLSGTLKDNEAIVKLFEDNGISKDDKVVTYCTGGIRSAYAQIVLEMCGYEDTYSYCQSFWRWAVVGKVE